MKTESGKKGMKLCMLLVVMFVFQAFTNAGTINLPHKYPRTNPNLLSNPTFNGSTSWVLNDGPVYQSSGSRTADGSGCIKFPAGEDTYSQLISEMFYNFEYNTPYTVSFYMKTQHEPVYLSVCLHMYDANNERTFSYNTGRVATSTTGEWQEAVSIVNITDPNVVKFKIVIEEFNSAAYTSDFFVDDVYFGKGISFYEAQVTARQTFSSSKVTIDELGNWRVYEAGAWKDFFPFGMYPNMSLRNNFISLSGQGFNTVLGMQFQSQMQLAADATSDYNPNGMRVGLRLAKYAVPGDSYWTLPLLGSNIQSINSSFSETLLCYDWDNENNWSTWSHWFDMVDTIRNNDVSHPIYILNGYPGVQRLFSKRLSDVCGTYTGPAGTAMETGAFKFDMLQYLENQDIPASAGQINYVDEETYGMRMRVYYCLINGAKAIFWWGDGYNNTGGADSSLIVENRLWWSDIPNLRNEIDAMLPILKQPHWTSWSASCSDSEVLYNTRDYQNEGYMIVMNPTASATLATFTLSGYTAAEVLDYFDDSFVTGVSGNAFTVLLSAHSTAVYRLVNVNYPQFLLNGSMETTGSPIGSWIAGGTGVITRDTTVKYEGNASCKIYNSSTAYDTQFLQYYPKLKPSTTYRFTVMMKTDNVVKDDPGVSTSGALVQLYAGGSNLFFPAPGESGSSDWHLVERIFTTPATPNATWYVRLRLWNASGSVWFDNASLVELNHSFILNGGMETAGSPLADWTKSGSGTVTRDVDVKYFGDASCKIINSSTAYDTMALQYYAVLKPATSYYFSARMKTDNVVKADPNNNYSGALVQIYAGGANQFTPIPGISGTNDWQLIEKTFITPATPNTTWYVRLRLWNASGTAWFDNVTLQEVP